jgi:hypothetical protein
MRRNQYLSYKQFGEGGKITDGCFFFLIVFKLNYFYEKYFFHVCDH